MTRRHSALLPLLLTSCAGDLTDYPSLAIRPIERDTIRNEVVDRTTTSPPAPAVLAARLGRLRSDAEAANEAFDRRLAVVERSVDAASRAAVDSTVWTEAQQDISRADAALIESAVPLAEAERVFSDLRLVAAGTPDTAGLNEARVTVADLAAAHRARVNRLEDARRRLR